MAFITPNDMLDPAISLTLRCVLALLFVRALSGKIRNPSHFANTIRDYEILPHGMASAVAALLLATEGAIVPALFIPATARLAAIIAAGLLLLYSIAIGVNLLRGRRDIDCGCAGPLARQPLHEWLLLRNAAMIAGAICAAAPVAARQLTSIDGVTVVLAASTLFALAIATDGLAALAARSRMLWSQR